MKKKWHLSPAQTIMISFALAILLGAALLCLPVASASGESAGFIDALFTATSAHCVTGQVVVNTMEHWSWFGKAVILILIQLGGIGTLTVMMIAAIIFRQRLSLRDQLIIQASFNQEDIGGMARLARKVVQITLTFEAVGAALLTLVFYFRYSLPPGTSLAYGVFHAISAFCNAGFDILSESSLVPYQDSVAINLIVMTLIVAGGLGFIVWDELIAAVRNPQKRLLRHRILHLSLHTKLACTVTAAVIVAGALLFLWIEWDNPDTMGHMSAGQKVQASLFQSITLRTAGFNTVPQDGLTDVSLFISSLLMFIGGSPASTAGGIKTVTLGAIVISVVSALRGRDKLEAFGRTLPLDLLQKALTVAGVMIAVILGATLLLHFTEQDSAFRHGFLDLLFETSSASCTVGVTTGITPYLSTPGKLVLIFCMYLGRLSPVAVVMALNVRLHGKAGEIGLPRERVIIG